MTAWTPPVQPVDAKLPPVVVSPYARRYVRSRATAHMYYTVAIARMQSGVFDSSTGMVVPTVRIDIYSGPARIATVSGPQVLMVGEDQMAMSQGTVSIPWDAEPVPHRDDLVTITGYDPHVGYGDPELVGRVFRILSVDLGGQMYAVRRMTVTGVSPSAAWGTDSLQ